MRWTEDEWLVLAEGGNVPRETVDAPRCAEREPVARSFDTDRSSDADRSFDRDRGFKREAPAGEKRNSGETLTRDEFEGETLHLDYQSLRIPMDGRYLSLRERPGWLRMYGRSGLASRFSQTLIAHRMTEYNLYAETCLDFEPEVFKQMAGLIFLYDTDNYLYLHISHDEDVGKCITLLKAENRKYEYLTDYVPIEPGKDVILGLTVKGTEAQFSYGYRCLREDEETAPGHARRQDREKGGGADRGLQKIGPRINASFLSDEACEEGWFTGAMVGICCQDLTGFGRHADFDWFELRAGSGQNP